MRATAALLTSLRFVSILKARTLSHESNKNLLAGGDVERLRGAVTVWHCVMVRAESQGAPWRVKLPCSSDRRQTSFCPFLSRCFLGH